MSLTLVSSDGIRKESTNVRIASMSFMHRNIRPMKINQRGLAELGQERTTPCPEYDRYDLDGTAHPFCERGAFSVCICNSR